MFLVASLLAQSDAAEGSQNPLLGMLPIVLIGVAMYFLLIRPQKKRMREAQGLMAALKEGDEVVTTGGIYGFVNAIDGDVIWLDIADNVEIRIHRSAVARRVDAAAEPAGGAPKADLPDPAEGTPSPDPEK